MRYDKEFKDVVWAILFERFGGECDEISQRIAIEAHFLYSREEQGIELEKIAG